MTAPLVLTVTCPWPPVEAGTNAKRRSHWSKYRGPVKAYRDTCFWLAKEAKGRAVNLGAPTRITIGFFPPDLRHRDDDNMTGAFKSGRDGIAQALGHDDRTWRGKVRNFFHEPYRPNGQIIVQIEVSQ